MIHPSGIETSDHGESPMRILWGRAALGVVCSVTLSLLIFYFIGPVAAMIEAVPGGLVIGFLSQIVWRTPLRGVNAAS